MQWPSSFSHLKDDVQRVMDVQAVLLCAAICLLPMGSVALVFGLATAWFATSLSSHYALLFTGANDASLILARMTKGQLLKWIITSVALILGLKIKLGAFLLLLGYALGHASFIAAAFFMDRGKNK